MTTILCVDDDPDLQTLLDAGLQQRGFGVLQAFTGEEGYEKALSAKPDAIILDMMLPTLNGLEVLKMLKAEPASAGIPVVVVSAFYGEPPFTHEAIKHEGAAECLVKPVKMDELAAVIAHALSRKTTSPNPTTSERARR